MVMGKNKQQQNDVFKSRDSRSAKGSEKEQTSQRWADGMMDPINQVLAQATRSGASTQPKPLLLNSLGLRSHFVS